MTYLLYVVMYKYKVKEICTNISQLRKFGHIARMEKEKNYGNDLGSVNERKMI